MTAESVSKSDNSRRGRTKRPTDLEPNIRAVSTVLALAFLALTVPDLHAGVREPNGNILPVPTIWRGAQLALGLIAAGIGWHTQLASLPGLLGSIFRWLAVGRLTTSLCIALPLVAQFLMVVTVGSIDPSTEASGVVYGLITFLAGVMLFKAVSPSADERWSDGLVTYLVALFPIQMLALVLDAHLQSFWGYVDLALWFLFFGPAEYSMVVIVGPKAWDWR